MPRGCVFSYLHVPNVGTWCAMSDHKGCLVYYDYISAWGLCVARFDLQGSLRASEREASDSAGLHAFFM